MKTNFPTITIYTSKNCPYSKRLKDWLYENEIAHKEIILGNNLDKIKQLFSLTGNLTTPAIQVDTGKRSLVIEGYNPESQLIIENFCK